MVESVVADGLLAWIERGGYRRRRRERRLRKLSKYCVGRNEIQKQGYHLIAEGFLL
jgi:hypothetical protein